MKRTKKTRGRLEGGLVASDLAVDGAALVAEAALPLAQLLLGRGLRLQEVLHRLHLLLSSPLGWS
jgi:hypothetical protein